MFPNQILEHSTPPGQRFRRSWPKTNALVPYPSKLGDVQDNVGIRAS
jgi:hypothetical protein